MTVLTSLVRPHPRTVVSAKVAFLAVVSCQFLAAATYYVSPAGSDSNNGSSAAPFRTIAKGVNAAAAGDTILLADGTYGNEGKISDRTGGYNGYATPVDINKAGRSDAWITLKAQNKGKAILDCGTTTSAMGCDKNIYLHSGAQYWSFEDMVFTRGAWGGIGTDEGASHIRIKGNEFKNIGYWDNPTTIGESAMGFDKNAVDWWIEGNVIHDIGRSSTAILDHGIYAHGTNATIINNVFYNMTDGWAVHMADGTNNWLIANNTFAFPHTTQTGHIMFWNTSVNVTIRNNIFYNPGPYAISRYTANISNCSVDHNLIVGGSMMSDSSGCSMSANTSTSDPKFANVSNFDFHVLQGGPGIDQGVPAAAVDMAGVARPQGSAPDIGAYEYVAGASGPSVSGVTTSAITATSAVISWSTDKASSSSVQYGYATGNYSFTSPVDSTLVTVHSVALSGLSQNTDYFFRVVSKDANGNSTNSSEGKFTTPAAAVVVPPTTGGSGSGSTGSTGSGSTGTGSTGSGSTGTTTPPATTGAGPVAMWDFASNTGNTTPDSSGNNNTGTLNNVTWRGDICSGCATFSGTNSFINVADSASISMTTQLTVSMWVMAGSSQGTDQRLIAKNYSWDVKLNGAGRYPQFSGGGAYAVMNTPMQVGMWQHLVMTFSNGTVKGYMNGQPVTFSANTFKGGEKITNYAYGLRIGADSDAANNYTGTLDDVRLYNRVLSDAEISNLYATTVHSAKITAAVTSRRARSN